MLKTGDVVKLKLAILGNRKGTIGFCFNDIFGVNQVIFENGNYDGFDEEDCQLFLSVIGQEQKLLNYNFKNVYITSHEYDNGYFPFENWK